MGVRPVLRRMMSGSVRGLVIRWRKESCEVRRRVEQKKGMWRYVGAPTEIKFLTSKRENVRSEVSVPCIKTFQTAQILKIFFQSQCLLFLSMIGLDCCLFVAGVILPKQTRRRIATRNTKQSRYIF